MAMMLIVKKKLFGTLRAEVERLNKVIERNIRKKK